MATKARVNEDWKKKYPEVFEYWAIRDPDKFIHCLDSHGELNAFGVAIKELVQTQKKLEATQREFCAFKETILSSEITSYGSGGKVSISVDESFLSYR